MEREDLKMREGNRLNATPGQANGPDVTLAFTCPIAPFLELGWQAVGSLQSRLLIRRWTLPGQYELMDFRR